MRRRALLPLLAAALVVSGSAGAPALAEEPTTKRLAGPDRYATAAAIVRDAFPSAGVPVVVIASGEDVADALAGAPAAAALGGPVLPVPAAGLPETIRTELARHEPERILILGGPAAVSEQTAAELQRYTAGAVTRVAGDNRYGTAARLAGQTFTAPVAQVLVATGAGSADALPGGAVGAATGSPMLLVDRVRLPAETAEALRALQPEQIAVLGGPAAVSDQVLDQLAEYATGGVARLAGANRYATAANVAEHYWPHTAPVVYLATGRDFPDALSGVDTRTGCEHSLHPDLRLTTASLIKGAVLGAVLLEAQDARRGLSDWERARIRPMIEYSHNNPYVSDLYAMVGGVEGMDAADRRWGATSTTNTSAYGATWTAARDRTRISLKMLHGGGPLAAGGRAEAWHYMTSVHPTQRWGISAGVPQGYTVALKNGFYPMRDYGWRVGSTGFVRQGTAGGYAFTVLTDGGSSQVQGMRLVEDVSRRVAALLAGGTPAPRSVDRAVCTTASSGETWEVVARRVGADAAGVRTVSGGNPSPLHGQRACSPTLRP